MKRFLTYILVCTAVASAVATSAPVVQPNSPGLGCGAAEGCTGAPLCAHVDASYSIKTVYQNPITCVNPSLGCVSEDPKQYCTKVQECRGSNAATCDSCTEMQNYTTPSISSCTHEPL